MKFNVCHKALIKLVTLVCFLVALVTNLLPFFWGLATSLKPSEELLKYPPTLLGSEISLEHYETVFASAYPQALWNSVIYSLICVVIGVVLAVMAAYAIARFRFKGKKLIFFLILSGIPLSLGSAALVVPNYMFFAKLGLTNKIYTLPLIYLAYNLPMATWVMIGGIQGVPVAIEEAAAIDGASRGYIIFNLIPRMCMPSIACAALFIFIGAWNEFTVSSVMVNDTALYPIQVSIYNFLGYFGREWGPLTAAATIGVIPIIIVFALLGKMMISGLTAGSVKE